MRKYTIENKLRHVDVISQIIQAIGKGNAPLLALRDYYEVDRGEVLQTEMEQVAEVLFERYFACFLDFVMTLNPGSLGSLAVYLVEKPYHLGGFSAGDPSIREPKNRTFISRSALFLIRQHRVDHFFNQPGVRIIYRELGKDGLSLLRLAAAKAMVLVFCDYVLQKKLWEAEEGHARAFEQDAHKITAKFDSV